MTELKEPIVLTGAKETNHEMMKSDKENRISPDATKDNNNDMSQVLKDLSHPSNIYAIWSESLERRKTLMSDKFVKKEECDESITGNNEIIAKDELIKIKRANNPRSIIMNNINSIQKGEYDESLRTGNNNEIITKDELMKIVKEHDPRTVIINNNSIQKGEYDVYKKYFPINDELMKKEDCVVHRCNELLSNVDASTLDKDVKKPKYKFSDRYQTRDISWMEFNKRILELAKSKDIPLLERFNFLSITASNLDEFTMVRLNKIYRHTDSDEIKINGMTNLDEYKYLSKQIELFIEDQNNALDSLLVELSSKGYELVRDKKGLSNEEFKYLKNYFNNKVKALLTPLVADNSRPFPLISNKDLHIGVMLEDSVNNRSLFSTIQIPKLQRVIPILLKDETFSKFILIEDLIEMFLNRIFVEKKISKTCSYRVLRNFDYSFEEEQNVFIADAVKDTLKRREMGDVMRVDITGDKKGVSKVLHKALHFNKNKINKSDNIIDLTVCGEITKLPFPKEFVDELKFSKFEPQLGEDVLDEYDIFDRIDEDDVILHHPYESYESVIDFVEKASEDNNIMAIKQTLYRVSSNSPIMKALIKAAENGKQVTVLLEVKARFDEQNNLRWASELERAGGHVIYGVDGLKTHCKMCMVVKRTKKGTLKKYVHIGTGNYNEKNASLYTDISLFTCRTSITEDVEQLFNSLTGFSKPELKKILASPYTLHDSICSKIDREIENAKSGKESGIQIKVNSFTDKSIIDKLYEAADNNVPVTLIVRGACSILDTSKIKVKSIVGRFLEHSRIFRFVNDGKDEIYIGSSDLMERNLYARVETLIPLNNTSKDKVKNILDIFINDTSSSSFNLINGEYVKSNNESNETNAQELFMKNAKEANDLENINNLFTVKNKK